jgi:hypothetical protein
MFVDNINESDDAGMETAPPSGGLIPSNSAPSDVLNNNTEVPRTGTEVMETEHLPDRTDTNIKLSKTIAVGSMSPCSSVVDENVIKPHPFTQPVKDDRSEQKRQESEQQHIISGSMETENRKSKEPKKTKISELTQKFESSVNIEGDTISQEISQSTKLNLKREISSSSADGSAGVSDEDFSSSNDDENDDESDKEDPLSDQQVKNKTGKKKTNLSKVEKDRLKKKERKERSKRRKLNLPEEEPVNDKKEKLTKKQKESTSLPYKVSNLCIHPGAIVILIIW